MRIDEDAAHGLRDGVETLHRDGRHLVIGGITRPQYPAFERSGLLRTVPHEDICPDLEFALARAVSLSVHQE